MGEHRQHKEHKLNGVDEILMQIQKKLLLKIVLTNIVGT